jgi:hypothetical protein
LEGLAQLALPLIGRVAAGSPILAQEHVDQTFYVENSLFQRTPDYLLKVRGMSMRDAGIMDGDLLAVQISKEAKNGQIVVARLGEEVTVKRFRRTHDSIELLPENPDFQTIVVEPGRGFDSQHHAFLRSHHYELGHLEHRANDVALLFTQACRPNPGLAASSPLSHWALTAPQAFVIGRHSCVKTPARGSGPRRHDPA